MRGGVQLFFLLVPSAGYSPHLVKIFLNNEYNWFYKKCCKKILKTKVLRKLSERLTYLRNLEERKADVTRLIQEQEKFTEEIGKALENATTLTEVEDIYRPFKPKKRTKATVFQRSQRTSKTDFRKV